MANTRKMEKQVTTVLNNYTISEDKAVGSVDVWKNYLAVGSADLKVVNLDGGRILLRSNQVSCAGVT